MTRTEDPGPRVVVVGMHLDPLGRSPETLLAREWRNFGRVAAAAQRAGARVAIVQAAWDDALRQIDGVPCYFVREQGPAFVRLPGGVTIQRRPQRLLERVCALAPDVIHFDGLLRPRGLRALGAALPRVPILAQDHGTRCPQGWRRWWYRQGFRRLAAVAFTARAQAAPFLAAGLFRPGVAVFEVLEVSSPFTPGAQAAARAATGLAGDPCLLWAGNLDRNKDPLTLLDAVALAASALPELRLHMCYRQAPLLEAVRARIAREPALRSRVQLLGEVPYPAIELYFRAADFLVQTSHVESCGAAAIDALACGVTPLVTDIPSFRRIVAEGAFGALVAAGDAGAFADAIRTWSRRDRDALRHRARTHFERELSFDTIGRELRAAYDHILAGR
jgi:glycosyltransferase involved in cell wall biosynthesis